MANRIAVEIQPYTTDSFIAASGVPHPLTFTHNAQQQTIQHEKGNTKLVGTALANNSNKESCTYIHCIYDNEKQTLTMKRVPIYNVHVQVDSPQTQNNNQANKEKPQLTAQEQKEQLGVTFGTRKKIRQIKEEEKNRINVDEIGSLNEQMQRSLQEKRKRNGTSDVDHQNLDLDSRPIPPCNPTATELEDVYRMEDLISIDELAAIPSKSYLGYGSGDELIADKSLGLAHSCRKQLAKALYSGPHNIQLARLALYVSYLMTFLKERRHLSDRAKLEEKSGIPPLIIDKFLDLFTENTFMSDFLQDKLISWICVVSLHMHQFKLPLDDLMDDLKLSGTKIKGYFKALGCDVKIDLKQNSKTAELLAPPVFPKPKKRK